MPIDTDHPSLIVPDSENIIFRYLDLDKFESLLRERSLFFCRADKFADPFEASTPRLEAAYRFTENKHLDQRAGRSSTAEELMKKSNDLGLLHKKIKRSFIVNCWHINKGESDAMWRLYLKTNEGVAIQSTVQKLTDALSSNEERVYMSKVRYIDYDNEAYYHRIEYPVTSYNLLTPIVHKRRAFAHETELRLFQQVEEVMNDGNYWDGTLNHLGRNISCEIELLIDKIILPPTADDNVKKMVIEVLSAYNADFEILPSLLNLPPQY